jgi:hypothetical protein
MTSASAKSRRPARISRWVTSGLTAAVAVGSVAAMAEAARDASADATGEAFGAAARYRGEVAAAELMAAADPGDTEALSPSPPPQPPPLPPRLGSAGVS